VPVTLSGALNRGVSLAPYHCRSRRALTRRRVLVAALAVTLRPQLGGAHAILEASEPANGDSVPAGAIALKLRFNSRIDRERSRLTLTLPDQSRVAPPIGPDGPPNILTASVTVTPGAYVLRWQVLAIDGHITRGDVAFTVTGR
jgi:methionine-rich copper-binding protein CopC